MIASEGVSEQYSLPDMSVPDADGVSGNAQSMCDYSLKVYTLGRFTIINDGQPVTYGRKSPGKPLQLLKALIANGARQISVSSLASVMWPDKDGDLALRSFEITLHRLRKHLGDDRYLTMDDGCLTLNSELVWVDVWECERLMTKLRGLLSHHTDSDAVININACANRILRIYQGHFLYREETTSWSVSLEERLRHRFIHTMLELGRFWERQGVSAKAIEYYQRGIEVDDLVENFYQRLIVCLDHVGRQAEAIACYDQCRRVLSMSMGLEPTGETQHIYRCMISTRQKKAG